MFQFYLNYLLFALLICHCSNLYHVQTNNYNNNYSFSILICSQLFVSANIYSLDFHSGDLQTRNLSYHKTDRITSELTDPFILPFYSSTHSVCRTFLKWKPLVLFAFQRSLLRPFIHVRAHTCLSLILIVVDLCVRCFVYTLTLASIICVGVLV